MAPTTRSVQLMIGLLLFKSSAAVLEASGLADALGVSAQTNTSRAGFQEAQQAAANTEPSSGFDLFGLFVSFGQAFVDIFEPLFQAELMLVNAGVPAWLMAFIATPIYLIIFRDTYYLISGR